MTNCQLIGLQPAGWRNSNKTEVTIAFPKPKALVVVFSLRLPHGNYLAVDGGGMKGASFGYQGRISQTSCDRFETTPITWLAREDQRFPIQKQTRVEIWLRYKSPASLLIKSDGTCRSRWSRG